MITFIQRVFLLVVAYALGMSSSFAGELALPTPIPVVQSQTATSFRVYYRKPLEQCVLVEKTTNGYGRATDPLAINFELIDARGERLPNQPITTVRVDQPELEAAATLLGYTWKPASSEAELSTILFALVRKLGAHVTSENLDSWAAQVTIQLKAALNAPSVEQILPPLQ